MQEWLKRFVLASIGALAATLAFAPAAAAVNLVYVGSDGNVHVASPDGAVTKQVTTDGTAEDYYRSPTQGDDGTVVAIRKVDSSAFAFFFNPATGEQTSNWLLPSSGTGLDFAPYSGGQISPDGGLYAYDYFHADGPFNNYYYDFMVGFAAGPGLTDPCTINCESSSIRPRWIPGTPYVGVVSDDFSGIWLQAEGGQQPWFGYQDHTVHGFDVRGDKAVVAIQPANAPEEGPDTLAYEQLASTPATPSTATTTVCTYANYAAAGSEPRISPDGSMIAWQGAEGVYVSPAPVAGAGGGCTLTPTLIAPGGTDPDWGPLELKGTDDGGGGGGAATCEDAEAELAAAEQKLKKAKKKLKQARNALEEADAKKEIADAEAAVKRAKKKVKKAKAAVRDADAAVESLCT